MWRPAAASITAGILLYAAGVLVTVPGPLAVLLVLDLVIYLIFYIVVWLLLPQGRRSAGEILKIVKDLRPTPPETKGKHDGHKENG